MKVKKILRKITRVALWLFLSLGALVLLLVGLLQIPAVQNRITDYLEKTLSEQLHTELSIGRVGIDFPKMFTIEEVYLETPAGDSLFTLGKLGVDMDMIKLFRKEIVIQEVAVEDVFAKVIITDSTSNIQFLLDAFLPDESSTTTPSTPTPSDTATVNSWGLKLSGTVISIDQADIYYQDDPGGILLDGHLQRFRLSAEDFNLEEQVYAIDEALLTGGNVLLVLSETNAPPDTLTEARSTLGMKVSSNILTIESTAFNMQSDSTDLSLQIPKTQLEQAKLILQDSIRFSAASFTVEEGSYAMDLATPKQTRGFDINHLGLQKIHVAVHDIHYNLDSIVAHVDQIRAVDKSGLALETLSGELLYQTDQLRILDFRAATAGSTIDIPSFFVRYNFQQAFSPESTLEINSNARIDLAIGDLLYFMPQLDTIELFQRNKDQKIQAQLNAVGNHQRIRLNRISLDGPGLQLRASGELRKLLHTDSLSGTIQLEKLAAAPAGILPLLPDSLLPTYIDWPQFLQLSGNLRYAAQLTSFDLRAVEQRDSSPVNSVLSINGQLEDLQQFPSSRVDLTIDTLRATRYSAMAYLPENSIPAGYNLPDFLKGTGTIKGLVNDLDVDVQLLTESERTRISVAGQVRQVLHTDSLNLDLRIPLLLVDVPELREILPDSTLPSDLNFPDLRITNGTVSGSVDDLNFRLPINTINGDGLISGYYATEKFSIDADIRGFQPEALFQGARSDTLALLELDPLSMKLESSGQLQPELQARLSLTIYEGDKGALLNLEGTASRDTFSGEMTFSHTDLQGSATATYIQGDTLQEVDGSVRIKRADLERWRLSDRPLYLSGQTKFSSKGLRLDDLSARLSMNDILLRSDTSSAFVDTLFAYAEMHGGNNEVEIFSDLLNFSLEGSFRPALVFGEINRFIQAYWREEIPQPDPVVYGNYLKAYLEVQNPKPLTSGIIPGLRQLSPLSANFTYRERAPELLLTARVPILNYAGIKMDSLKIDSRGSEGKIEYQADWKGINLFDQVILGRTQIKGENTEEAIRTDFRVWSDLDELQHYIQLILDPEPDSLRVRLASEQLIDKTTWNIPKDNLLLLSGTKIQANNWELSRNEQRIVINTPTARDLLVQLEAINLAPFSHLIRSEEEIIVGVMDGLVKVTNPLGNLRFDAEVEVSDLSVYDKLWGDLSLDVANQKGETYRIDLQLAEAANEVSVVGTVIPNGKLDLKIDIGTLMLEAIEPLSLGYLSNAQGHIAGNVGIGGTFSKPSYQGELRFVDAAIDIALLKTRFQIENEAIRFNGQNISINKLTFYDPQNNQASLSGSVRALSLSNYAFNLNVRARDFLVLNTNEEDNNLYYGYLRVDADVAISGDVSQPILEVTASPKENSRLTYNLVQNTVPQAESRRGIVRFVEKYEWQQTIVADSLKQVGSGASRGFDLTTTLNVNPGLAFTVVIDPLTGDRFSGSGEGDIVFHQYPDGRMEMTGRIEMVKGVYDFTYQGLISRQFRIEQGSSIAWQGDPMSPSLDLTISSYIQASPYPLVSEFTGSATSDLRRQQTFAVRMYLKGTLEEMQVNTDIVYPEDVSGNSGLPAIGQSLSTLRTDQSQLNTQAFGLLLFKGFVNFGDGNAPSGGAIDNTVQSGLDNVLSQQLNNLANRYINFVELDFGLESFNTGQGGRQRDLRLSLRKRLFNDRLIISIDGVTQTGEMDENNSLPQTYLDNLTAEFLLSKNGGLRLKIFSNRELDQFTTGDVVRIGGRLAFTKDFNRFFWASDERPGKKTPEKQAPPEEGSREGEQKIQIEKE